MLGYSDEWVDDCLKWHGKVLHGKYSHWCYEWDFLPIDETCGEFDSCLCYNISPYTQMWYHWRRKNVNV